MVQPLVQVLTIVSLQYDALGGDVLHRVETTQQIMTSFDQVEALEGDWRDLEMRCADPLSYFQTFAWCHAWLKQYARDGRYEPYVATLWRGDRLAAVWPLVVASGGVRRLMTLGAPHSQYCGLLAEPGLHPERDLKPLLRQVLDGSKSDVAVFRTVPEGTTLSRLLRDLTEVEDAADAASMLDLSPYASSEDYTAQLGKLQKRNRNRRRNHLARLGELEFSVVWPGQEGFDELVRQCTAWKQQWLAEMGLYSAGFAMPGFDRFLSELEGDADEMSGAVLSVLKVGGQPVAIELGFLRQGHYYAYMGGFDWSLRELSPGKVQMDFTVCWLIDQSVATYDLLTNSADYKKSWSSRSVAVQCRAQALTWKGQLYTTTWLPRVRPALKRLRNQLPELTEKAGMLLRTALPLLLIV